LYGAPVRALDPSDHSWTTVRPQPPTTPTRVHSGRSPTVRCRPGVASAAGGCPETLSRSKGQRESQAEQGRDDADAT